MSNIVPKDSSKVSYTQKLIISKKFDNFAKITLRVNETGPSKIYDHNNGVWIIGLGFSGRSNH